MHPTSNRWARCGWLLTMAGVVPAMAAEPPESAFTTPMELSLPGNLAELFADDGFAGKVGPLFEALSTTGPGNELVQFLADLNIHPKLMDPADGDNGTVLGFEYAFEKSIKHRVIGAGTANPGGVSLTVKSTGTVALSADDNPENLLESGLELHFFRAYGGIDPRLRMTPEAQAALDGAITANSTDADFLRRRGPEFDRITRALAAHLVPQYFVDLQAHATLEADQRFRNKQWTYGGKLAFVCRDWGEHSPLGRFNLFDYPFAAVRWLFEGEGFRPSGRAFPSLVAGLDQVDPSNDEARFLIDPDTGSYARVRLELAFKTRFLRFGEEDLYFHAAYRRFRELGASDAIKSANLDQSGYFIAKLDLPAGFFVSYSKGDLPIDHQDDKVYSLGWSYGQ